MLPPAPSTASTTACRPRAPIPAVSSQGRRSRASRWRSSAPVCGLDLAQAVPGHVPGAVLVAATHLAVLGRGQEQAVPLQELQGVPLLGVVAGGDDHAADGVALLDRHLGGRRGGDADVHHVVAGRGQGRRHRVQDHGPAGAGVAADHDRAGRQPGPEGRGPAGDRDGIEAVADHAADTRNADSQGQGCVLSLIRPGWTPGATGYHQSRRTETPVQKNLRRRRLFRRKISGAGVRNRTADLLITSELLYQLSYTSSREAEWCLGAELNHRHPHFQCGALPAELPRHQDSLPAQTGNGNKTTRGFECQAARGIWPRVRPPPAGSGARWWPRPRPSRRACRCRRRPGSRWPRTSPAPGNRPCAPSAA